MSDKRLALGVLVAAAAVVVSGSFNSSTGQSTDTPGISYGGAKGPGDQHAWLRLDRSRRLIANVELPYSVKPERCTNRKRFSSFTYEGVEWDTPIFVNPEGAFRRRFTYDYRENRRRIQEVQTLRGTVTPARVTLSVEGTVRLSGGGQPVARCTYGPQQWVLFD